jgi:hypothetical protein
LQRLKIHLAHSGEKAAVRPNGDPSRLKAGRGYRDPAEDRDKNKDSLRLYESLAWNDFVQIRAFSCNNLVKTSVQGRAKEEPVKSGSHRALG